VLSIAGSGGNPGGPHCRAVVGDPAYRDAHATCAATFHAPPRRAAEVFERFVHERAGGTHVPGRGAGD